MYDLRAARKRDLENQSTLEVLGVYIKVVNEDPTFKTQWGEDVRDVLAKRLSHLDKLIADEAFLEAAASDAQGDI